MTPNQEAELVGGGVTSLHEHENMLSQNDLHRLQQLEKVVFVSADYTARREDDIIYVTGSWTITLPLAPDGKHVVICSVGGASTVTVAAQSGETVNGASSVTITTNYSPLRLKAIKGVGYLGI